VVRSGQIFLEGFMLRRLFSPKIVGALSVGILSVGIISCRATRNDATVKDAPDQPSTPPADGVDPLLGSPESQEPIVSVITDESEFDGDHFENHGSEFWLYGENGRNTGHMTFDTVYGPYRSSPPNPAYDGKSVKNSTRRCMKQASETLKRIEASPHPDYTAFMQKYDGRWLSFFGWIDDYRLLTERQPTNARQGPFNWQSNGQRPGSPDYKIGGYIKWHGVHLPDGTCKTPSLGQFLRLLKVMDNCETNPGPSCTSVR
jgi:hypothetical protein